MRSAAHTNIEQNNPPMVGERTPPQAFINKGVVQKADPSQLAPGEFYQLENTFSQQEGALTSRTGHQKLSQGAISGAIVSLSKLNLGGADSSNPRYGGSGPSIYRYLPPYLANISVFSGLTSGARWTAQQYNAGTAGLPSLFFATQDAALRDNGTYTTLQKWGIDPPPIPVTATPLIQTAQFIAMPGSLTPPQFARFVPSVNSDSSGAKEVSAISGANPGYTTFTPKTSGTYNGVNGIYVGMLLEVLDGTGGNEVIIVLAVTPTTFSAVTTLDHIATNVALAWFQVEQTTVATTTSLYGYTGLTINAAFNGTPDDGYSTSDSFHIALRSTDVTNVTQIEIRAVPNFSGSVGTATDYYSYKLVPAAIMSVGSTNSPAWVELNISKAAFTPVGNAGGGQYNWSNINEIDVIATANANGGSQTVASSSIYFIGGGGLNDTAAGTTPYDYLYVFRNPKTNAVGNPCVPMIANNFPPNVTNSKIQLTLTGTAAAATIANGIGEISGPGSIKIYRRGGTFSDGFYRHIGYATNPGSGATVQFTDNASDQSLDTADTLEFDNDPPVPSSLPTPLTANILHFQPSGGGGNTSANTPNTTTRLILSNLPTASSASTIASVITVGSTLEVGFGLTSEEAIISAVGYNGANAYIEVFLQYAHSLTSADPSETIECDAILRGACDLVHQDFDCLFLAGDPNNPATLYQSKVGRPESFPVVNLENNFAQQINVGSPSNPIYGVTSIGPGELVCLNLNNIFIVQVWAGQMQQPIQAPASRGLYQKWCWCKGDNRIWYLAYDGIYTWAGGESQKVTEKIDYLFKKQTVNGLAPIDYTQTSKFSFAYAENSLYVTVIDTNNVYHRLRYETIYQRWTVETIYAAKTGAATYAIDDLFVEPDTGNFLVSVTDTSANSWLWFADFFSTTDGWVALPTDGISIQYTAWRYWPLGDVTADYQVGEVIFELENPADAVTVQLFYNYATTPTNTIAIASGAVPARNRFWSVVNSAVTAVQYSIGLKLTGSTGEAGLTAFYSFGWRDYPWLDGGYPGPKTFNWISAQVNSNDVAIPMQFQIDGALANLFTVQGTFFNRASTITLPSNLTGYQYRVVPVAGTSGTVQIYGMEPQFQKLPMPVTHYDTLRQIFGNESWHIAWQMWIDFQCAVPVIVSIYRDGDVLFYQQTLSAQTTRGTQRFYLPAVNTPAGGITPQFNKSIGYQILFDSQDGTTQFQVYRDGTRLEIRNLATDQRGSFDQKEIWELIPLQS